ncbi:hypothetical protein ASC95_29590 [Pelomonas sp. Root1217]|nr:hypothetical protein ASC95_29590 [Pelomonas sp. Root1217]
MLDADADDAGQRRAQRHGERGALQRVAAVLDGSGRGEHDQAVFMDFDRVGLGRVMRGHARLMHPLSVSELHDESIFLVVSGRPAGVPAPLAWLVCRVS